MPRYPTEKLLTGPIDLLKSHNQHSHPRKRAVRKKHLRATEKTLLNNLASPSQGPWRKKITQKEKNIYVKNLITYSDFQETILSIKQLQNVRESK